MTARARSRRVKGWIGGAWDRVEIDARGGIASIEVAYPGLPPRGIAGLIDEIRDLGVPLLVRNTLPQGGGAQ